VLADRLGEVFGDRVAQGLLARWRQPDAGFEDPPRRLAVAKAGQPDLAGDLAERLVDVAIELGLVDIDRDLDLVPLEGLHRTLHRPPRLPVRCARSAGGAAPPLR
jgi:hypothetical protein